MARTKRIPEPEDTNQISADNLRADFLNATTNWQRWKVLNRALDWAVAASENAAALRNRTSVSWRIEDPDLYRQIKAMKADVDANGTLFGYAKKPPQA